MPAHVRDSKPLTGRRVLGVLCFALVSATLQASESVQALRYGVTLFHFYQQDYFPALTELMAAQQLRELGSHADTAELLRGGMSLSYGMDRVAEQIFQELLSEPREAIDGGNNFRDPAWFYLAKLSWQRNDLDRANQALAAMSPDYTGRLVEEADYLHAAISLRLGDELLAAQYGERLPDNSPWRNYHFYNMGAAQAARGDWSDAIASFGLLDKLPAQSAESKALRDRAFTASGYAQMATGQMLAATEDFKRVRLDSPMSDRALLGYGWASGELGDYRFALSPWQALSQRSLMNESARESLLAIPYAYEQLGKHSLALNNYRRASEAYSAELSAVRAAIDAFRNTDLQILLELGSDTTGEWLSGADFLPAGQHAPYIRHLITRHSFQLAMRELRDLHRTAAHLSGAAERLQVLTQVDSDQQRSWSTVLHGDAKQLLQRRRGTLQARIKDLRQQLVAAEADGDARWFANAEQAERWQRLDRASAAARQLGSSAEQSERLRLYRGLMLWEDSEQYPARVWEVKRQVQELAALEQESAVRLGELERAIASRQQPSFAPRIGALGERVSAQSLRVEGAITQSEYEIRRLALVELTLQSDQLSRALGQSQLAIARLYDRGSPEVPR